MPFRLLQRALARKEQAQVTRWTHSYVFSAFCTNDKRSRYTLGQVFARLCAPELGASRYIRNVARQGTLDIPSADFGIDIVETCSHERIYLPSRLSVLPGQSALLSLT